MTAGPLEAYLGELEQALRTHGHEPSRIVDEAREHLADAVADAVARGLTREDAEREAIERFGPAALIAAQAPPAGSRVMARMTAFLDTVIGHWRWLTAATALAALLTSVASHIWLPTRYRSETVILVVPAGAPTDNADALNRQSLERLQTISTVVLSRPRLEWIAKDFGLNPTEDAAGPAADPVQQMRRNISVEVAPTEPTQFTVSFQSPDPRLAMRVTERIASLFVEENLRDREAATDGTALFFDAEIDDVRRRLMEMEARLSAMRASNGEPASRAEVIPFEMLQDRYRDLLVKREDARSAASLARRQIGEQFRVLEAARLPDRPVGPSRASVNTAGTLAGLMFGLVVVGARTRFS